MENKKTITIKLDTSNYFSIGKDVFFQETTEKTKQHYGVGKHVYKAKKWLAIVKVNPASKFGKDMIFLDKSNAEGFEFNFSKVKAGDVLEYCETEYQSNKYYKEHRAIFEVVDVKEDQIILEVKNV